MRHKPYRLLLCGAGLLSATDALADQMVHNGESLQAAIASATAGERFLLEEGATFSECLTITVPVRIEGAGATPAVIDCGGSASWAIAVSSGSSPTTAFSNLEVRNAGAPLIYVDGSFVAMSWMVLSNATGTNGPALTLVNGSSGDVRASEFSGNSATSSGGAVYLVGGSSLYVSTSSFDGNHSDWLGGAISVEDNSYLDLSSSSFYDNSGAYGGALNIEGASYTAQRLVEYSFNDAEFYGGAVYAAGPLDSYSSEWVSNHAGTNGSASGGGVAVDSGSTFYSNYDRFESNSASLGGGAVAVIGTGNLNMRGGYVGSSSASTDGGGVLIEGASGYIAGTRFEQNSATRGGGLALTNDGSLTVANAVFYMNTAATGGGAAVVGNVSNGVYFYQSDFLFNVASIGGGFAATGDGYVYAEGSLFAGNHAYVAGGGVAQSTSYLRLASSEVSGNTTDGNGAGASGEAGPLDFQNTLIAQNVADGYGGGVYVDGGADNSSNASVSFFLSRLSENQAGASGGGAYTSNAQLSSSATGFDHNVAALDGGGIGAVGNDTVYVDTSLLCANQASGSGGGIWLRDGQFGMSLYNTALVENYAALGGAIFETGAAPSSYSSLFGLSVFGNTAGNAGYDGIVNDKPSTVPSAAIYDSVFSNNGTANVAITSGAGVHSFNGNVFDTNPSLAVYNETSPVGSSENYQESAVVGTGQNGWLRNTTDCYDSRYRSTSTRIGYYGSGVGIQSNYFGYNDQAAGDDDGDLFTPMTGDCDDDDATINPSAADSTNDSIDQDCHRGYNADLDGDYLVSSAFGGLDCDDTTSGVDATLAESIGNGVDDNCDGYVDDSDRDGYSDSSDCMSALVEINYDAIEIPYDGIDQDCSGADLIDWDHDGWGAIAAGGADCDDADASVNPAATDTPYDGIDTDCSGGSDFDADSDGSDYPADCDDNDSTVHPGADETCDLRDEDCDGSIDDGAGIVWWSDDDGDGYGDDFVTRSCTQPANSSDVGNDCDDVDSAVNPGAAEIWYDGVDQDCDGGDDFDQDGDSYTNDVDCDDTDPTVHPGAGCSGDADGDGIEDDVETANGMDPNNPDSDFDTFPDGFEFALDSDGDGETDATEEDDDGDGVDTIAETLDDADSDGVRDTRDSDGDLIDDERDQDDDGDGILTITETAVDTDGDGTPDYLDLDSDDDLASDASEGSGDADGDEIPDYLDDGSGEIEGPPPPLEKKGFGLGCASGGSAPIGLMGAFAALLMVRRRR